MYERFHAVRAFGFAQPTEQLRHRRAGFHGVRVGKVLAKIRDTDSRSDAVQNRSLFAVNLLRKPVTGLMARRAIQFAQQQPTTGRSRFRAAVKASKTGNNRLGSTQRILRKKRSGQQNQKHPRPSADKLAKSHCVLLPRKHRQVITF